MKYMLLTYSSPGTWERLSWREQDQRAKEHAALVEELFDSGEYVDGNTLTAATRHHHQAATSDTPQRSNKVLLVVRQMKDPEERR